MRLKAGVSILGVRVELLLAMQIAQDVYRELEVGALTITSVTDSRHSRTSLHYVGLAFDIRTRNGFDQWDSKEKHRVARALRIALQSEFDVVVEGTHIHIEYQPKR